MATTAGYSGKPLTAKLGITKDSRILVVAAPPEYRDLLAPLPDGVSWVTAPTPEVTLVHHFATRRDQLAAALANYRKTLAPTAVVWVSWPKRAAKMPTDISEDVIREVALPLGFVDIKVCAVSDIWSGLKLMVRRELR